MGEGLKSEALRWGFEDLQKRADTQAVTSKSGQFRDNICIMTFEIIQTCISFELDTLQDPRAALRPALIYEAQKLLPRQGGWSSRY